MDQDRRYRFHWDLLGDIQEGRPNLGNTTRLEIYRLMQFTFRDVLEERYGSQAADELFYDAGKMAGVHFYDQFLTGTHNFDQFVRLLQQMLREMGIGILRIEQVDLEAGLLILTVSEDLDCSGLPENGYEICVYDEGFIAAILQRYTGKEFHVKEVDCWCTGDRTCRFRAQAI